MLTTDQINDLHRLLAALVRAQTSERRDQEMLTRIHGFHAVLRNWLSRLGRAVGERLK